MWDGSRVKEFFAVLADKMAEQRDYLIELDSVVGDGDLGLTMSDGFRAASEAIMASEETDPGKLFYAAGKAIAAAVPSTMGTLMGSGLMSAGKELRGKSGSDREMTRLLLRGWLAGVAKLGKAKRGEKTFLDGMTPALEALEADPQAAAATVAQAARTGAQETVGMLAVHGRAAIRGEQSRELLDPGAVTAALIVEVLTATLMREKE